MKYTYIDNSGAQQTVEAPTPEIALSTAPNIAAHSGVQAIAAPPTAVPGDINAGNPNPGTGAPGTGAPAVPAAPETPDTASTPAQYPAQGVFGPNAGQNAPQQFQGYLQTAIDKLNTNSDLMKQRNLIIKQLYDQPLNADEVKQLPEGLQQAVTDGNKPNLEMQLRLINDSIAGRRDTMSQSLEFLTNGYTQSREDAEKQRQDAITNVLNFATQYGSNAPAALRQLYGDDYINQLSGLGIDVNNLSGLKTIAEQKADSTTGDVPGYNGDFGATIDLAANANKNSPNVTKNAIRSQLQSYIASGDYDSAYQGIIQQTGAGLDSTNATRFTNAITLSSTLTDLQKALQAYGDAGGDTNIFTGTQDQIQTKIGQLYTNPKYAALAAQLDTAYQNYRLMLTGANFSSAEASAYASVLPSKNNSLALNLAKIAGAQAAAKSTVDGDIRRVVGEGGIEIQAYANGATPGANSSPESQIDAAGYDYNALKQNFPTASDDQLLTWVQNQSQQ